MHVDTQGTHTICSCNWCNFKVNVKDCEFAVHTVSIRETVNDVNSKSFKIIQNTTSEAKKTTIYCKKGNALFI